MIYRAVMSGPPVEWEFRDRPEFYDKKGQPRTGWVDKNGKLLHGHAPKVVRPGYAVIDLHADSVAAAKELVRRVHPEYAAWEFAAVGPVGS